LEQAEREKAERLEKEIAQREAERQRIEEDLKREILKVKEDKFRAQVHRLEVDKSTDRIPLTQRCWKEPVQDKNDLRGLGVISGIGKRNFDDRRFCQDLIIAYNASNPDPGWEDTLWCPVLSKWMSASAMAASHIFSYEHGQQTMSAIFGTPSSSTPETVF